MMDQNDRMDSNGEQAVSQSAGDDTQSSHVNPIQIQKFLRGVDYPCSKDELLEKAKEEGADENIIETLKDMPMDQFNSPNDVSQAIGQL